MKAIGTAWLAAVLLVITTTTWARSPHPAVVDRYNDDGSQMVVVAEDELPSCPDYSSHAYMNHTPPSPGRYQLSYQRPEPACRKFILPEVEETIHAMARAIRDPDLFRLFENCFPNTLDTAITWKGVAADHPDEELTFITTGDINAMWLRDSANQLQSYRSLLRPNTSSSSLASLFRGAINLQARYILAAPFCNAFHAPPEAAANLSASSFSFSSGQADYVTPPPDPSVVFECKYELDSLAAFLQLSHDYFSATSDAAFFARGSAATHRSSSTWVRAVHAILNLTTTMQQGTYSPDGTVLPSPYLFQRSTSSASETLPNSGAGSPVAPQTGLVRSAFRPSDDACTYQLLIPANMMLAHALLNSASIASSLALPDLAARMRSLSTSIQQGIEKYGRTHHRKYGRIYAYEVDGFGSANVMDDANIPSLLSAPLLSGSGFVERDDPIYQNTRRFVLSRDNPYYMFGPVINGTGGPHVGPGMAWPMSLIVRIMTSDDDDEIYASLKQILASTNGLGLIHESVSTHDAAIWTRQWFSWANGLFGQMMLDLRERKPHLLRRSYQ